MKRGISSFEVILLLCGVLGLCCASFAMGRTTMHKWPAAHAVDHVNELDHLQMETAAKR